MSPPIPSDSGARVPSTTGMEDAAPGWGDESVTTSAPEPTCPVCMEPWTCNGDHRICCIPCGHVYGRSCLERWLHRCGDDSAKCPQCGEIFEDKLIINLYAPGNLWDGCCRLQELKARYESEIEERVRRSETTITEYMAKTQSYVDKLRAELVGQFVRLSAQLEELNAKEVAEFQATARAEWDSLCADAEQNLDQVVRMWKEEKATDSADLTTMKERMKKMAEEENATATELIEFMEGSLRRLSLFSNPQASASAFPPAPVDSQNNTGLRQNRHDQLPPVQAPPRPADVATKRQRRGT